MVEKLGWCLSAHFISLRSVTTMGTYLFVLSDLDSYLERHCRERHSFDIWVKFLQHLCKATGLDVDICPGVEAFAINDPTDNQSCFSTRLRVNVRLPRFHEPSLARLPARGVRILPSNPTDCLDTYKSYLALIC